ncbi:Hypothetical protein I595_1254 [Croceitalea dokdonensis DOKDO 023]|uniref:Uncharacterized protein n=1 Tax=Croceitalea dokdonensis DOKDO 023 TaxID=1300341 RepID=A0A0P7AH28_9FLAO|nr:hypothetical protein [Croceitalea dokdonensis]KPM32827.1 Hypothetical protein I595_1254 [Croceitalea dokdonensis DOKDO 023]
MANKLFQWGKGNKSKGKKNNTQETIQLVEGVFSPAEAADVLLTLINDKIKFHTIHALKLKGEQDSDVDHSEQRISELREAKKRVHDLVINARNKGLKLNINSVISISEQTDAPLS